MWNLHQAQLIGANQFINPNTDSHMEASHQLGKKSNHSEWFVQNLKQLSIPIGIYKWTNLFF